MIGETKIEGKNLCRPCKHLQELLNHEEIIKEFIQKGGLRCEILVSGIIKVADKIIPEPLGGAHNSWNEMANSIKNEILSDLNRYKKILDPEKIVSERYQKFRNMGRFEVVN